MIVDRRQAYAERAQSNASHDVGPWLSVTILKDSAKRARNMGWQFNVDRAYLVNLWHEQQGRCAISGMPMQTQSGTREEKNPYRASLDRVDNSQGYVRGNVRFVCHWVNNAKSTWADHVFDQFIGAIVESRR